MLSIRVGLGLTARRVCALEMYLSTEFVPLAPKLVAQTFGACTIPPSCWRFHPGLRPWAVGRCTVVDIRVGHIINLLRTDAGAVQVGSDGGAASVDGDHSAGQVASLGRGQEGDELGDLARLGCPAEKGGSAEGFDAVGSGASCEDRPSGDSVDPWLGLPKPLYRLTRAYRSADESRRPAKGSRPTPRKLTVRPGSRSSGTIWSSCTSPFAGVALKRTRLRRCGNLHRGCSGGARR